MSETRIIKIVQDSELNRVDKTMDGESMDEGGSRVLAHSPISIIIEVQCLIRLDFLARTQNKPSNPLIHKLYSPHILNLAASCIRIIDP